MSWMRILSIVVLVLGVAGAAYYTVIDEETQGAVVVLLGILYFVAVPHVTRSLN